MASQVSLSPQQKSTSSEIQARLTMLKAATDAFNQVVMNIDFTYDSKLSEITALQMKLDKLKSQCDDAQNTANKIVQDAQLKAQGMLNEATKMIEEAKASKLSLKADQEKAQNDILTAKSLIAQAADRQKMADDAYRIVEDRKKKLESALHI